MGRVTLISFAAFLCSLCVITASAKTPNKQLEVTKAKRALEKYNSMQKGHPGQRKVYYDYIEDGQQKGGSIMVSLPPATLEDFQYDASQWNATTILDSGPSTNRIDIVFVGDGYTASEIADYSTHVDNILITFMAEEPLVAYSNYFNIHQVDVISNESGIDEIDKGIYRDTALDMAYGCHNTTNLLCIDKIKALAAALQAPDIDEIIGLANSTRYAGTGGGIIAILPGNNEDSPTIALHEFGHSLAELGDEYDFTDGAIYTGSEPPKANLSIYTAEQQENLKLKWYRWLDLPNVDTYEGAYYNQYGIYRPTFNSKMRDHTRPFEEVNVEQFVKKIYEVVSPIDDATPVSSIPLTGNPAFYVTPMQPTDHNLDIQWSLDGLDIPGATGNTFIPDVNSFSAGIHVVTVTVTDNTLRVRDPDIRSDYLTASRHWQIETFFPADIDKNGVVNNLDFALLAAEWKASGCDETNNFCNEADFNRNSSVGLDDLLLLSEDWLQYASTEVYFVDPNLKTAVENELGIIDPNATDMLELTYLDSSDNGITDLTGIQYATNLLNLNLSNNNIRDISAISGLIKLTYLNLSNNDIDNVSAVSNLTALTNLSLNNNYHISDISPISGLTNLTFLSLSQNHICDITAVSDLTNLVDLYLERNHISDIFAVSGLMNLARLNLGHNAISDITGVSSLTKLTRLDLGENVICDIFAVSGLTSVGRLDLDSNMISNISTLSGLTKLNYLNMRDNPLETMAYCNDIPLIQSNNPGLLTFNYDSPNPNPLTSDCSTDFSDFTVFASYWLNANCEEYNNWCGGADLNHINDVDIEDLAEFVSYWLN